jgi:hypothetical protein
VADRLGKCVPPGGVVPASAVVPQGRLTTAVRLSDHLCSRWSAAMSIVVRAGVHDSRAGVAISIASWALCWSAVRTRRAAVELPIGSL